MRKLGVFDQVSVDGYFATPSGDIGWMHRPGADDAEHREFVEHNARSGGELLFGRKTYDQMVAFWPTPAAAELFPVVAKQMTELPKYVVSRTLRDAGWQNTRVLGGDLVATIRDLKASAGPPIAILGSGSIVAQLTEARLIDEYQLLVLPVVLGAGRTLFGSAALGLRLVTSRVFRNGNVYLVYQPER